VRRLRRLNPVRVPPAVPMTRTAKLRLVTEILACCPRTMRLVRSNDLEGMVAQARSTTAGIARVAPEDADAVARRLAIYVHRVVAPVPTDNPCLIKSLVLLQMLWRRSIDARLVIGARSDGVFAAHAWVEHDGRAILPIGPHERLVRL
jgi:hypothetical protein